MLSSNTVPKTRLILATSGTVTGNGSAADTYENVRDQIVDYVRRKIGDTPHDLKSMASYEKLDGSVAATSLSTEDGSIWIVRFNEPDDGTPGRSWVVELSAGLFGSEVLIGCRLYCYSRNYDFEFERNVPRILRIVLNKTGLLEYGIRLRSVATKIETAEDVNFLAKLIRNADRWRNVVVISCDDTYRSLVDPDSLAKALSGVAHVFFIAPQASFLLSSALGKQLSVFDRGIRVYKSNFSEDDDKSQHPLILRRQLEGDKFFHKGRYEAGIKEICFQASIERKGLAEKIPSFVDIRLAASRIHLQELGADGSAHKDEIILAEQEARSAAETQAQQALALAIQEEELRVEADAQRDSYRAQLFAAQSRIEALEAKLTSVDVQTEIGDRPTEYVDISQWVETNFPGKLLFHSRVQRGLKTAIFSDISIVCDTLSLLANEYRQVCLGQMRREDFDAIMRSRHLDMSGSISESRAKEYGDEYYVAWNGKREFLHGHIEKGNSRDERYCLRIYFFWSAIDSVIVVGWLPSHLKNRLS